MTSQANRTEARHKHLCMRLIAIAAAASFLAACDTGGGVGIASGQNPDPVAVDFAIAYVKRPIPVDANGDIIQSDIREVFGFDLGANLYTRDRAAVNGIETNITFALTCHRISLLLFSPYAPSRHGTAVPFPA